METERERESVTRREREREVCAREGGIKRA